MTQQEETEELQPDIAAFCDKTHADCGHPCKGVPNEDTCLPCLNIECAEKAGLYSGTNEDELCGICYTTELGSEACSRLACGHVFHTNCVVQLLRHRWSTVRISFAFMSCPSCKQEIELKGLSKPIQDELAQLLGLRKIVEILAMIYAREQGILDDPRLSNENDHYFGNQQAFANDKTAFYQCYTCKVPYFGGLRDCEQEMNNEAEQQTKPEHLLCPNCRTVNTQGGQITCKRHGDENIDWKCMYCCTQARYHCYGTHYYCIRCHDVELRRYGRQHIPLQDCNGINCPLGVAHPPASVDYRKSVFSLGCGLCRTEAIENEEDQSAQKKTVDLPTILKKIARVGAKKDGTTDFTKMAGEMEVEILREERIKNFYVNPMRVMNPRQAARRERLAKRKLQKKQEKEQQAAAAIQATDDQTDDKVQQVQYNDEESKDAKKDDEPEQRIISNSYSWDLLRNTFAWFFLISFIVYCFLTTFIA